jgi:hypothetical protein
MGEWVKYNPETLMYETGDGTKVAAEIVESVQCLADILVIAQIRERQRNEKLNAI